MPPVFLPGTGCGGNKEKRPPSDMDSPPSTPSTVEASPPPSPHASGHPRDPSSPEFSSATPPDALGNAAPTVFAAAAAADGAAREPEKRAGCSSVLLRRLKALHERYGEFAEENGYVRCEDTEVYTVAGLSFARNTT